MNGFGFIGVGNMGYPMLKGFAEKYPEIPINYTDASQQRMDWVEKECGIKGLVDISNVMSTSKFVVLAVKPQYIHLIVEQVKQSLNDEHILISIMAGQSIDKLKSLFGTNSRVIRSMPNTPAMVGEGMSAISYSNDAFSIQEKEFINNFFSSFGKSIEISEDKQNAIIPISGSSPAYVFVMIEAMADAGVLQGLDRQTAYTLAAQTIFGSAKLFLESQVHPGVLKDQVCSPGGTTIEAIASLEATGFRNSIITAMNKCYDKANKMSGK